MNYQRITISLPDYIYEDLLALVPRGKVSGFVAEATEERVLDAKLKPKTDPIDSFLALRKTTKKLNDSEIMNAIRKGRA